MGLPGGRRGRVRGGCGLRPAHQGVRRGAGRPSTNAATARRRAAARGPTGSPATPDPKHISTSYVERQNLNIRMQNRRFTRLTNAFSKKLANHAYQVALYTVFYNFCRIHKTLKMTPAMAAGLTDELRDVEWIAGLVEARDPAPGPRGPYKPRTRRRRDARTP